MMKGIRQGRRGWAGLAGLAGLMGMAAVVGLLALAGLSVREAAATDWSLIITKNQITSTAADGDAYRAGETVTITVTFNKPVRVIQTTPPHQPVEWPELEIEIGDTNRRAAYSDQSINVYGHTEHHWEYTVVAADRDVDGISMGRDAIKAPHAVFVNNDYRGSGNINDYAARTRLSRAIRDPLTHRVGSNLPLLPPENFEVSYRSNGVDLTWDARSGATKYIIYRQNADSLYARYLSIHTVVGGGNSGWRDTEVRRGRPYAYKIATVNRNGTGPQSGPAGITLPP